MASLLCHDRGNNTKLRTGTVEKFVPSVLNIYLLTLKIKAEPKGEEKRKKRAKEGRVRMKGRVYSNH